jgi:hypothetical protein
LSPHCSFHYLLVSVPDGWTVPGRKLLSREGVAGGIFGQDGEDRAGETRLPEGQGNHLLLRFLPSGPPGRDGFLHFTYVNGAVIGYDPKTGAATFTVILQASLLASPGFFPVTVRALSLCRPEKRGESRLLATESSEIAVAVAAGAPDAQNRDLLEIDYRESGEDPAPDLFPTREQGPSSPGKPEKDGISMDFPALGRGDRVIGLTCRAPDPDKGRVRYDGAPVPANPEGLLSLGGDLFQPGKISFRAVNSWKGAVRLGFIALVRHEPSGAEREVPGSVTFLTASGGKAPRPPGTPEKRAEHSAAAERFGPPGPPVFEELAPEGTEESAADVWSAFSRLTLSDCLAHEAQDIDLDLLPRRAYLQEYRVFSGTLADEVVPRDLFRTEDSAPAGFRLGGLEFNAAALLDLDEDFVPLPLVTAYSVPLGSFLPGGGVFGGFDAGFFPAREEPAPLLSPWAGRGVGGEQAANWEDLLTEDDGLDFIQDFPIPDPGGAAEIFSQRAG